MLLSSSTFSRRVSYETMRTGRTTARPLAMLHCLSCEVSSALEAFPSTAKGVTASFPSHLTADEVRNVMLEVVIQIRWEIPSSFAQLRTKLDGQAITHF